MDGSTYSGAIALTDGTPDDIMIFLICSVLNGNHVTSIFKPTEGTRYGSITGLIENIGPKIKTILIVMDQEDETLQEISKNMENFLSKHGCDYESNYDNKILHFSCTKGPRSFILLVVLNGLDQIDTQKHCIEDHLIFAGKYDCVDNSKSTWKTIPEPEKEIIITSLVNSSRSKLEKIFPQHFKAISLFKKYIDNPLI